jgi:quercetin dioxygenase-like cupin family protein
MSDPGYTILDLNEIEAFPYHQREGEKLLTIQRLTGFRAAGINGWIGEPGEKLVPEHEEDSGNEELYAVVRGRATFTVDEKTFDAPAGTLLHVMAGEKRTADAEEPGTIIVAVGGSIGEAFKSGGWTSFVAADALRHAGRLDEAREAIQELLDLNPGSWAAPYNAACFEALAGDADAAFAYLARARELAPEADFRQYLEGDGDLDPIRDDPRFQELLA